MTRYNRLALLLILGAGLLQVSPWSHGAPPSKSSETGKSDDVDLARRAVEQSLLQEMFSPVDRRRDLDATLQRHPESDLLRWQTGYVRDGDQWRPFEQAAKAVAGTDRRSRYAQRREQAPMTGAGQLALANWCREQGMHAQERAHLSAVLVLEPDLPHVEIHERLGDRLFGHQWLSPDQIQEWIALNRRSRALLAQWGPQFEKLASQLEGSRRQRDYALASLRELTDPAAIPALEYTLCGRNTEAALVAVEVFQRMDRYEATLALTKQAVFSKEPRVRAQATEALKERPLEEFAPGLIALLTTAAKAEFAVEWRLLNRSRKLGVRTTEFDSQFILFFNYLVAWETDDQFQVTALHTTDYRLNSYLPAFRPAEVFGPVSSTVRLAENRAENDFGRTIATEKYQAEKHLRAENERAKELNSRVIDVLANVSGQPADPQAQTWWRWWENYADTQRFGGKRVVRVEESQVLGDPRARFNFWRVSCFTAGTPVWTDSGMRPIEQLRIGDQVLAKDVETGELTCRSVLHTSVRPARELVRVLVDDETITATGGHRFWVSGKGWLKARDLKPGMLLHTVTGTRSVGSVVPGPIERTYNLVVDDFHSYFVGRTGFLVQDLPLPQPTNSVVPGLSKAQVTANGFVLP